jgi:ubiquinone/menaquinone biosynthesis C-methylase UbiE
VLLCWQLQLLPASALVKSDFYSYRQPSFDGIGKSYMGREIARVMGHEGASWLERSERATEEKPQQMVAALGLQPQSVVAEVGAGSGYITQLLAAQVPQGRVLAIDLQPEMLALLQKRIQAQKITNIEPHLGIETDPQLDSASIDLALMVDAYHEFSFPREMMTGIVRALKPGGRVVLAEYRGEDPLPRNENLGG